MALQLCSGRKKLHGLLVKHRPKGKGGWDAKKEADLGVNNVNGKIPKWAQGTSRAYIEQRLQQDSLRLAGSFFNTFVLKKTLNRPNLSHQPPPNERGAVEASPSTLFSGGFSGARPLAPQIVASRV